MKALSLMAACAVAATAAWAGPTPEQKCQAGKNRQAGSYAFCRAKAEQRRVLTNDLARFTTNTAACAARLASRWAKLEERALANGTTCPSTDDVIPMKNLIDGQTGNVAWQLSPDSANTRFKDNGDGTISDKKTGLTWEKKVGLDGTPVSGLHDADNPSVWAGTCTLNTSKLCQPSAAAAAACAAGVEGDATGCGECSASGGDGTCYVDDPDGFGETTIWQWLVNLNVSNFAGHGDWRVPTREELETIVNTATANPSVSAYAFQGASCGTACTDVTSAACSCTNSAGYISATTFAADPGSAWWVWFDHGQTDGFLKQFDAYVRAVRTP